MDPTQNIVSTADDIDETQMKGGLLRQTLSSVMHGFKTGNPARCWYTFGNHISRTPCLGLSSVKTFVLAHTQGEFWVGHLGYLDGSFTFMRLETFTSLDALRKTYPDLFALEGYSYDF